MCFWWGLTVCFVLWPVASLDFWLFLVGKPVTFFVFKNAFKPSHDASLRAMPGDLVFCDLKTIFIAYIHCKKLCAGINLEIPS